MRNLFLIAATIFCPIMFCLSGCFFGVPSKNIIDTSSVNISQATPVFINYLYGNDGDTFSADYFKFSDDEKRVVFYDSKALVVFDLEKSAELFRLSESRAKEIYGEELDFSSIFFHAENPDWLIVYYYSDRTGKVDIWDFNNGSIVSSHDTPLKALLYDLSYLEDDNVLIRSDGSELSLKNYEIKAFESDPARYLATSTNGSLRAFYNSHEELVKIFNTSDFKYVCSFGRNYGNRFENNHILFIDDSSALVAGTDKVYELWQVDSKKNSCNLKWKKKAEESVKYVYKGVNGFIYLLSDRGMIKSIDATTGEGNWLGKVDVQNAFLVSGGADGRYLAIVDSDHGKSFQGDGSKLYIFDTKINKFHSQTSLVGGISNIAISANGGYFAISGIRNGAFQLWKLNLE